MFRVLIIGIGIGVALSVIFVYYLEKEFWKGFSSGIITGIATNLLWEWIMRMASGKEHVLKMHQADGMITISGQVKNTPKSASAVNTLLKLGQDVAGDTETVQG